MTTSSTMHRNPAQRNDIRRNWNRRFLVAAVSAGALTGGCLVGPGAAEASSARVATAAGLPAVNLPAAGLHSIGFQAVRPKTKTAQCSADSYLGDKRLGPAKLPKKGPVGLEMIGYQRTGGLTPAGFLAKYWDPSLNSGAGGWLYPPQDGYLIRADGTPIQWEQQLWAGLTIDRYGSEYGGFLSPAGLPYFTRAIPPTNLNGTPPASCNYHQYRVLKPFGVDAGPIAAWFAQPGGGLQYQLDTTQVPGAPSPLNVLWLVDNGYLARVS
jgi:hypothetical protein